jgi:hypothetical protein
MKERFGLSALLVVVFACASFVLSPAPSLAGEHRIGGGVHYWQNVEEIGDDFPDFDIDEDGLAPVVSYQYVAGLMRFELAAEYFEAGFQGSTEWAVAPQAYVLVGRFFYGGVGVGVTYSDNVIGDDFSDPYFIAKAGIDMLLLPKIHLDINADYRFTEWEQLDNYSTETVTLGATVRVSF